MEKHPESPTGHQGQKGKERYQGKGKTAPKRVVKSLVTKKSTGFGLPAGRGKKPVPFGMSRDKNRAK